MTITGAPASVLAAISRQSPTDPYTPTDLTQRRAATFSASNRPDLPSLMNDVVFLPQDAFLDANVEVSGTFTADGAVTATAGVDVTTAGDGLAVAEGSNAKQGTATLSSGSAVVSNTSVTANSRIFLTGNTDGGTPGWLRVSARTAGTSFTITSSSGSDASTVAYEIFEPG